MSGECFLGSENELVKCSAAQLKHTVRRNISVRHSRTLGKLFWVNQHISGSDFVLTCSECPLYHSSSSFLACSFSAIWAASSSRSLFSSRLACMQSREFGYLCNLHLLQGDLDGLRLDCVVFHLRVPPPLCPFGRPSLPNYHLHKQKRAERGTNQIKVNET